MADKNVVYRGAEAVLYKKDGVLVKDRIRKGYRIQQLDRKIRKQRTRHEDSLMERARRAGVDVPRIFSSSDTSIEMEFIEGRKVKDAFNGAGNRERGRISGLIGQALGRLHEANIVHGDFTTSNMILKGGKLYVIDMGLGKYSEKVEDKSVDLYLLHEALKAAHFKYLNEAWQKILKSYGEHYTQASGVLRRLERIEKRRRYKG